VGDAKAAVLQSNGIETAADVVPNRIIQISGFGPKTVDSLVQWRKRLEQSFRFDPSRGISPADIALIENAVALKRRELERRLSVGLSDLRSAVTLEVNTQAALKSRYDQISPACGQAFANATAAAVFF
jgi:DNA-binding helix-hairpin-helix protein with protein kinase domain